MFGGGYCKIHQYLRDDSKKKRINKVSEKGLIKKEDKKELLKQDFAFYQEIWDQREHICFNCKQYLGSEPSLLYMDHILEKSKYPQLRHIKENICLLCWDCHTAKTNGKLSEELLELRLETIKLLL